MIIIFDKKFYPHLWLMILYIPLVFFIKNFLPEHIARENGPIENFQLCLLAGGIYLCWQALKKSSLLTDRYIWQGGMVFFALLFGREISWGRALFMHTDGSMPQWSELGLYGQLAHPLVGVAICLLLVLLYRGKILDFVGSAKRPMWDILFLFLFVVLVEISEHYNFGVFHGEIDEELFECAMYVQMLQVTAFISKQK